MNKKILAGFIIVLFIFILLNEWSKPPSISTYEANLSEYGCEVSYIVRDEIAICNERNDGHCAPNDLFKGNAIQNLTLCMCQKMHTSDLNFNKTVTNYCHEYYDIVYKRLETPDMIEILEVREFIGYCNQSVSEICDNKNNFFAKRYIQ